MAEYSLEDEEYRRREYMFQAQEWNKKVKRMYNQNKLVNGVTLSYETVFGINYQKIHRNLINVGEGHIIFSVGSSVAIKDLQTKTTKFFTKENRLRNISCLNAIYEKDENILIAVGESTPANEERAATVTLINTKENKWVHMNTNQRAYIKEIIIESDKKYCAALVYQFQSSYPQILFWNYQKEKMIGQAIIKIPIEKMSFDPIKPKQILIQTPMYLRVWELDTQDKTLKEAHTQYLNLKKEGTVRVLDHCWLPHGNNPILLILCSNNILHIAQNDVIKKTHNIDTSQMSLTGVSKEKEENDLDNYLMDMEDKIDEDSHLGGGDLSPMSPKSDSNLLAITQGVEFSCIAPTKKGFILGGTKGIIGFYEIEKSLAITNALSYQCPNPEDCKVVFVSTNQNDSITSAVTANVSNGKFNYFLLNIFQIDSGTSPVQQFFNTGYHSMAVTSMSVCRSRSILATCSDDGYVKLWNYFETEMDEKKGFISQYFKETPSSVSLHPCSQFLAVAFGTFYKIFSILTDSLQTLTTVNLTSCKLVKYTNGGHYLIANERSNIIIFDTVYYDALHIFDSHTSLIKDFVISEDDKTLVSTCEGGFVYVWDLVKPEKNLNKEWRHKNTMYNKILYDSESDLMYGCTGEKPVCIYGNLCKEKLAEFIASTTDHDTRAAVISTKHQVLFTGTNKGAIKVFLWPMVKESFEIEAKQGTMGTFTYKFPECVEYNVHLSPVTYLEVSHDGNYLFTGAADGSVFIFKITDVNFDYSDPKKGEKDEKKLGAQANDIYLEKLSKIKEQNDHIKKLHFEVTKGQQAVKIELKKLEMMFKSKIETINEEFNVEMKANSEKKDRFTANALRDFEARDEEHSTLKGTYIDNLKHSVEDNKFKEEYEIQRNKDIEQEMEDIKVQQQAKLMTMYKKYQKELEGLRDKYQEKCQGVQAKYNAVTEQAKASGVYFLQKLEKHEVDCERENEEKTKELIIEIAQEKNINKGLVEINTKLHGKNEAEKRMDTEKQNKLDEVIAKNNRLKEENINHMASLLKMQEQILEREEVILSKEETCKAARDEQINLENFRYLLDQKIKTLTNEKDSMLDKISSQEKLLKDTFQELITESGKNDQKHEHLKKKETKLRVMDNEQQKVDNEIMMLRSRLSDSINSLDKVIGNKEKEKWPEMLHNMLDKARNIGGKEKVSVKRDLSDKEILEILKQSEDKGFDVNDELLKQAKWITKKLYLVNVTGKKLRDIKEESIQGILAQNGQLIEECNTLRTDNETLSHKMKFLEKVVQDGMKKMKKMENTVSTPISMKMNKSQVKLEKISTLGSEDDTTKFSPTKDAYSPDLSSKTKKMFNSEQKARSLLSSNKASPEKKTKLASVSPQKSTSKSAKGLGFMLHEVPNQAI